MLKHNLSVARANVSEQLRNAASGADCRCIDYFSQIHSQMQDVVFFDPPWGGEFYSAHTKIALFLGDRHMAEIVVDLYRNSAETDTKYVVIKACNNFAVGDMREMLGELSAAFAQIPKEDRVKILHVTYNRKGNQKYVVYYVEFPPLLPTDVQKESYDPHYRPIASNKCRIYIEVNDVRPILNYCGTFYLEQDLSNDDSVLALLQNRWNNRSSDHVPIVLNIVRVSRRDLSVCGNKIGYLEMDSRVDMEHFKSLPAHQVSKLDTYSGTDEIDISTSQCYSKSIDFLRNCQQKNKEWMNQLQEKGQMLLVYVIGLDQYPMIIAAENVNDVGNSQNKFCLHAIPEEKKFKAETHFQLADTEQLSAEQVQELAKESFNTKPSEERAAQIMEKFNTTIQLNALRCIARVIEMHGLSVASMQRANKIISEYQRKFRDSPDEILKLKSLLEQGSTVKPSVQLKILKTYKKLNHFCGKFCWTW